MHDLRVFMDAWFGEMVKVVMDVDKDRLAIGGDIHADAETMLIATGSEQKNIWGANVYPELEPEQRIEYTALINIRPGQGNPSMEILDNRIKYKVKEMIKKWVIAPDEKLV